MSQVRITATCLTLTRGAISPAGKSKYGIDGIRSASELGGIRGGIAPEGKPPAGGNPGGGLLRSGR